MLLHQEQGFHLNLLGKQMRHLEHILHQQIQMETLFLVQQHRLRQLHLMQQFYRAVQLDLQMVATTTQTQLLVNMVLATTSVLF